MGSVYTSLARLGQISSMNLDGFQDSFTSPLIHYWNRQKILRYRKHEKSLGITYTTQEEDSIGGFSDTDWGFKMAFCLSISGYFLVSLVERFCWEVSKKLPLLEPLIKQILLFNLMQSREHCGYRSSVYYYWVYTFCFIIISPGQEELHCSFSK